MYFFFNNWIDNHISIVDRFSDWISDFDFRILGLVLNIGQDYPARPNLRRIHLSYIQYLPNIIYL